MATLTAREWIEYIVAPFLVAGLLAVGGWVFHTSNALSVVVAEHKQHTQQESHPGVRDDVIQLKGDMREVQTEIKSIRREQKQQSEQIKERLELNYKLLSEQLKILKKTND